jgi:hypothetical protein
MKPQSRYAQFLDRFVAYLKDPNPKSAAAAFGTRGAEQAARAAINRTARHQEITSVRRNSRGLPLGIGVHQLRAAKRIKNALASRPDEVNIGETRLHAAETTLDAVKRNAAARARIPRKSKLARRIAALR